MYIIENYYNSETMEQMQVEKIEEIMLQVVVEDFKEGPKIIKVPVLSPGVKEVLIKVECAPLSTFERIMTQTTTFLPPFVMGVQASGTIVSLGDETPKQLLNKKVLVVNWIIKMDPIQWKGVWSQYLVKKYDEIFVYDQSISHELACGMHSNPVTALGIMREIEKEKPKVVVLTPGASAISKILTKMLKKTGITVISIVRSDETVKILKEMGHESVLNSSDPNFEKAFSGVVKSFNPTMLVDAVSNEISAKMFAQMPDKSIHLVYGALGGKEVMNVPVFPLVISEKIVRGYILRFDNFKEPMKEIFSELQIVNNDLVKGGEIFGTPIVKQYPLSDFKLAIEEQPTYASKGRGIIKFH